MTEIVFRQCWNYSEGREGLEPDRIVIHHWGADGQSHDGVVDFFTRGPGSGTSAHYVVSAGRITQICHDYDTAYHAGNWAINLRAIGIECRPEASEDDVRTVAELVRRIRSEWGYMPLTVHSDYYPTACPGRYHDLIDRINQLSQEEDTDMQLTDTITRPDGHSGSVAAMLGYMDMRLERLEQVLLAPHYKRAKDGTVSGNQTDAGLEIEWTGANFERVYDGISALSKRLDDLAQLIADGSKNV